MADRDQFGPRLRREREKRRISLDEIASATNVGVDLWEGLENNDFSRWPSGLFARAFVRDYAQIVGLDPDAVIDEFCRHFPIADRRAARIVQAKAALIGHPLSPVPGSDPLPPGGERRRTRRAEPTASERIPAHYRPRITGAALDLVCVGGLALLPTLAGAGFWTSAGVVAVIYFTTGTILAGTTPGTRLLEILRQKAPALFTSRRAVNA